MDWTQIIITTLGVIGSICTIALPIILPIVLNRTHKKTRELADEGNRNIGQRIDKLEGSVEKLTAQMGKNTTTTQGLHLLDVIEHRPHCWETIRQAFIAYSEAGGNGHVERVYKQWENDFGQYFDRGEVPPALMKGKRQNKSQEQ